ncbi:glycosyltransferase family 4 protein [Thermofilum pendens]|uniref:Glycosyl transferase, group 1 n=1 Tax=Thermofilum pendens (strain DSM 2475 / Hrk 5) TaxID=368408 RepID=A1S111_THEPD|nr:glycosyltransferase family 4 protein [Thermofilum pendens]ABL79141.1 glycosyl transferase, group 1 [Thermofilum pendens Hrk 5]
METFRLLVVSPRVSGLGGVAQHVGKLVELLRRDGHEVEVVSAENTPILPVKGLMNPSFAATSALKVALGRLKGRRYDVVHAHNVPSAPAMRAARGGRVLTLHGVFSEQVGYLHGGLLGRLSGVAERVALGWADRVTSVSRATAEHYSRIGVNVVHVPNAVDPSDLPGEGERMYERQVVYSGRLSREKGVDLLVKAFRALDVDAHLVVVGGGPLEEELRSLAGGDPRIHFLGPMPRERALRVVKGSDVFVLPSRYEGLSTALLEAMAMGVPVVATKVGGNTELVEDGKTGLLVEPSPEEVARAVRLLLEDSDLAARLASAAKRVVAEKYSWDKVYAQYLDVYREVAR